MKRALLFPPKVHWLAFDSPHAVEIGQVRYQSVADFLSKTSQRDRVHRSLFTIVALHAKLKQHPDLLENLKKTGDAPLGFASPDPEMGVGYPLVKSPQKWTGANWVGKHWMMVRECYRD